MVRRVARRVAGRRCGGGAEAVWRWRGGSAVEVRRWSGGGGEAVLRRCGGVRRCGDGVGVARGGTAAACAPLEEMSITLTTTPPL